MDDVDLRIHRGAQHLDAGHVKNRHFERRTIAARRSGGSLIAADIALLAATALVRSRSALRKNRRRRNRLHQQDRDSSKHYAMSWRMRCRTAPAAMSVSLSRLML